jgi:hypothetical protein
MDLVDLEFLELGCLARKSWSGAVFWIWSCVKLYQTRLKLATNLNQITKETAPNRALTNEATHGQTNPRNASKAKETR